MARVVVAGLPDHVAQRGSRRQDVFFLTRTGPEYLEAAKESAEGFEKKSVSVPRIGVVCAVLAALQVSACRRGDEWSRGPRREGPPLRRPEKRLTDPTAEAEVMDWADDLRGDDYLGRVKAEEELDRLMRQNPEEVAPYLVQLLDEPQLDIRVAVIRLFAKYGRESPEAVEMLVEAIDDPGMSTALRADAARTLRRWTGKDFGYRPWTDPEGVEEAGKRWKVWFGETSGYIAPPPAPPEPESRPEPKPQADEETSTSGPSE